MATTPDAQNPTAGRWIDEQCDGFEAGWQSGTPVPLESVVLSAPEPLRAPLFRELLAIESEYRVKLLRPLTPEEAQQRFGGLGPWTGELIREILAATGSWAGVPSAALSGAPPPRSNHVVGPYELLRKIGSGAHGVVYKARHRHLQWLVALKVLFPERALKADALDRFMREKEALGKLNHPNVVRATDANEVDGYHYLAMEFVDGADLGRVLSRAGRLTVPDACEVVRQAAEGLAYIEQNRLVHRDIKPQNLLLGRTGVVRVVDLGLARLLEPTGTFTETGEVMGTPDYIAPEQALESRAADIRADVYSLGCTLFALLTGAPPFAGRGTTAYQKFKLHADAQVPPLAPRRAGVPPELEALMRRMLEKTPAARPSPAEVARGVAPFCPGHDLAGLLPPPPEEPGAPPELPRPMPKAGADEPTGRGATTHTFQRTKPEGWRGTRPLAVLAAAALAVVGASALWLALKPTPMTIVPGQTTINAVGTSGPGVPPAPLPPRPFAPGEEYDLLDREPTVLAWPEDEPTASKSSFEERKDGKKILRVDSRGIAMLQLADLPEGASGFDLNVEFSQAEEKGGAGVGVFVRGRAAVSGGTPVTAADYFIIEAVPERATTVAVSRGRVTADPSRNAAPARWQRVGVPFGYGSAHRLALTAGPHGPGNLVLGGAPVNPGLFAPFAGEVARAGASGAVGVMIQHTAVVFESVRLRVHKPGEK